MTNHQSMFSNLRISLMRLSIYKQIIIGNSIIILFGAIGGTLLTRHLTDVAADLWLIVLFATIGTTLTILINGWVIRTALRPLHDLSSMVNRIQIEKTGIESRHFTESDPDIRALANALNALVVQLEERNRQLQALSARAINAQEEERKRIARSLHDDTGQALSMLIIDLERLENKLPENNDELFEYLSSIRQLASNTLGNLRKTIYGLRPTMLDDLGLVPAIRWYARSNLEEAGIRVEVVAPEESLSLSSEMKTTLFRIAQEAINNIVKHSNAKSAHITLVKNMDTISLQVEDDGHGFDVTKSSEQAIALHHWGLIGIRERADLVGGKVIVDSKSGLGTQLEVIMPLQLTNEVQDG